MVNLKETELVSVIVNCYNGEKYLEEAINSIIEQTYNNFEIIFWDNCSTDQTQNIILSYNDSRIRYFRGDKNVDVYKARNYALSKCNGNFIAFLDSDDYWYPSKLEKQIPLFDDSDVGLVFSDSYFFNEYRILRRNYKYGYPKEKNYFSNLIVNYHLDIETVVLRKSILEKFDLKFNNEFNCVGDADLFLRVAFHSKIKIYPEILAKWRIHQESITYNQQDRFIIENKKMLTDLDSYFKNNGFNYTKEINCARKKTLNKELFFLWKKDKPGELRSKIKKLESYDLTVLVIFIISFFPFRLFLKIKKIFRLL